MSPSSNFKEDGKLVEQLSQSCEQSDNGTIWEISESLLAAEFPKMELMKDMNSWACKQGKKKGRQQEQHKRQKCCYIFAIDMYSDERGAGNIYADLRFNTELTAPAK
jgi:hypothetical protein